jgi:hypothetical protein
MLTCARSSYVPLEEAEQQAAIPGWPEQVLELIDRADRPPLGDAQDGGVF